MQIDYPFRIDGRGRTALSDEDDHVRDMIEQLLFTAPGERVNRPEFGCGLLQLVFAPNSDALAATTQFTVAASLQQWLGDVVEVESVNVDAVEATLTVEVKYIVRRTRETRVVQFSRGTAP